MKIKLEKNLNKRTSNLLKYVLENFKDKKNLNLYIANNLIAFSYIENQNKIIEVTLNFKNNEWLINVIIFKKGKYAPSKLIEKWNEKLLKNLEKGIKILLQIINLEIGLIKEIEGVKKCKKENY